MKSKITSTIGWILFALTIGFTMHIGTNTAKLIWPSPPIEFAVTVSE